MVNQTSLSGRSSAPDLWRIDGPKLHGMQEVIIKSTMTSRP
jgi:hypothetical protein